MHDQPMSLRQTAAFFGGVSVSTIRQKIKHEGLPAFRLPGGRQWFVLPSEALRWCKERRQHALCESLRISPKALAKARAIFEAAERRRLA